MSEQAPAPAGHNNPPVNVEYAALNEGLADRIVKENDDLVKRKKTLLEEAAALPKKLKTDEDDGKFGDFIRRCRAVLVDAEAQREKTKRPILDAGAVVDALFKKFGAPINEQIKTLNDQSTAYKSDKEEKARKKLEADAQAAREEEDRRRAEADKILKKKTAGAQERIEAVRAADQAAEERAAKERAADIKPAELSRVRGDSSTSSLVEKWNAEITDFDTIDLNKLRKYITRKALIEAGGRAATDLKAEGVGLIKGLRIWATKENRVSG